MEIFVGNLSFAANESDINKLFEGFGNVASAVILRRKEKKAPKSRGFGFVQMPDEQQALAAITALNGKEFMGRALSVAPARPKAETKDVDRSKEKSHPSLVSETGEYARGEGEQKKPWLNPAFNKPYASEDRQVHHFRKPGSYKGGRRSLSYMKRRGPDVIQQETNPRRRNQENPMRWRKNQDQAKPWQKSPGEHRPWKKPTGDARPWKKAEGEFKSWNQSRGGNKPWNKPVEKTQPWKKAEGEFKPWGKSKVVNKPWNKSAGDAKPWSKGAERTQKPGFKARKNPRSYKPLTKQKS